MELTTDNLIKIAIGVFVIVTVILGVYFAMRFYIIPYFSGIWSGEEDGNIGGSSDVCDGKIKIGRIEKDKEYYFWYEKGGENEKTPIYFKGDKIKFSKDWKIDDLIGRVQGDEIEIFNDYKDAKYSYSKEIDGALIGGKQVCKA